jgi:3-methylcrotonyl-CoA carboxylase alpha subunit
VTVRLRGRTWRLALPDPATAAEEHPDAGGRLVAPIPGVITAVAVTAGAKIARGQLLVTMEAMKTVFRLVAHDDAVVASVACAEGDQVGEGRTLVVFAETNETDAEA